MELELMNILSIYPSIWILKNVAFIFPEFAQIYTQENYVTFERLPINLDFILNGWILMMYLLYINIYIISTFLVIQHCQIKSTEVKYWYDEDLRIFIWY